MKYLYTLLICSLIPAAVFSQTNFQPGYIIKAAGDTVKGEIDYREWNKNPKKISFQTADKQTQSYSPTDIREFSVTGFAHYRSFTCSISMAANQGVNLSTGIDTSSNSSPLFLRVLVDTKPVALYSYTDDVKSRYLTQDNESTPVELRYSVYYDPRHETSVIKDEAYKRQLITLAVKNGAADQSVIEKLGSIHYREADLVKAIRLISHHPVVDIKGPGLRFFAGAGISYTSTKITGLDIFRYSKPGTYTAPTFNMGVDLFNNRYLQKALFRVEAGYSWINPGYYVTGVDYADSYSGNIKQTNLTILPQLIYNFYNTRKFKIHGSVGLGTNFSTYKTHKTTLTGGNTINDDNPYEFNSIWFKVPVEVGAVLNKRVELFARYSFPTGFSNSTTTKVATTEYQMGIHFLFGKRE